MDAQLRQRLIGAAVLIALAVIFLPLLLDGKKEIPTRQLSIDIPEQPSVASDREVTVPAARQEAPIAEPELIPGNDAGARTQAASETTVSVPALPEPATQVSPGTVAPGTVASGTPRPETAQAESKPATVKPPAAPQFDVAQSRDGRFALSFGSYGDETNAKKLIAQLAMSGLNAVSEPVQSGGKALFRVRALGFASRAQAEQARLRAKQQVAKVDPQIIALPLPDAAAPSRVPASGVKQWMVQLGVFSEKAKAEQLVTRLKAERFPAFVESIQARDGPAWRVRIGPHVREGDAKITLQAVKDRLRLEGFVASDP